MQAQQVKGVQKDLSSTLRLFFLNPRQKGQPWQWPSHYIAGQLKQECTQSERWLAGCVPCKQAQEIMCLREFWYCLSNDYSCTVWVVIMNFYMMLMHVVSIGC